MAQRGLGDSMQVGDLVNDSAGCWIGIITKYRGFCGVFKYHVEWTMGSYGWYYADDLEVINESR